MYVPTTDDMLANAYNNYPHRPQKDKISVIPRATLEKNREFYADHDAYWQKLTLPLDSVPRDELRKAMEWYRGHTDWSAFKKRDWQAAYATLEV